MAFLFADAEVLRLTVHCVSKDKCSWIHPYRADHALPQRKAAGESDDGTGSDDHGRSSGSDGTPQKVSDFSQSDKDNVLFCSSDDSDVEMGPRTSGEESKALAVDTRMVAWGFYTWI